MTSEEAPARTVIRAPGRILLFPGALLLAGAAAPAPGPSAWLEPGAPFHSSVVDLRGDPARGLPPSLTPRGLVLLPGQGLEACFDVDLLRIAAIWHGGGLTPVALAPGSYHDPARSTPGGQRPAPTPRGRVWTATGPYPGWQRGDAPRAHDPRPPAPSPEEPGRGPLPASQGRLRALQLTARGPVLELEIGGVAIRERLAARVADGRPVLERHGEAGPGPEPLCVLLGAGDLPDSAWRLTAAAAGGPPDIRLLRGPAGRFLRLGPRGGTVRWCVTLAADGSPPPVEPDPAPDLPPPRRWAGEVTTTVAPPRAAGAAVLEDLALPLANPWGRQVRLGDVQFRRDGTAFGVTLDGDVWRIRGLAGPGHEVRWSRFASGFHEPMSLALRDDGIFVFDRNGLWRLVDAAGDGEADRHELFSAAFAQTADMREFPNTVRAEPGGGFVIAKGGQQATTLGKHNGTILRVSADGRDVTVLGHGFRQPFLGVHPETGQVTASDQQGQYIPTTPLHVVEGGRFHGFLSTLEPREQYPAPIAEPLVWLPHAVNASGASQVWLLDPRQGEWRGSLLHLGFNRPELFLVLPAARGGVRQAAVVSLTQGFDFPPLYGAVNPADGQLYVSGFQILGWGTTAPRVAGFARVRLDDSAEPQPRAVVAFARGVLLRFPRPLDPTRVTPGAFRVATWNYRRSHRYGSPQLRADGTSGVDWLAVSAAFLSRDGRGVLVGVPDLRPAMQLQVGWTLAEAGGTAAAGFAHLTPAQLAAFDAEAEGFAPLVVPASRGPAASPAAAPPTAGEGGRLARLFGCAACHSLDGTSHASLGPSWLGLHGSLRRLAGGRTVTADDAYLRRAILDPAADVVAGFQKAEQAMPSYAGVLDAAQVDALLLFIRSLAGPPAAPAPSP